MSNKQASQAATSVAVSPVRAKRLAAYHAELVKRRVATKQAEFEAAVAAFKESQAAKERAAAYEAAVAQAQALVAEAAAKYGVAVQSVAPRANSATSSPSKQQVEVDGVWYLPTKAVHALCDKYQGVRKHVLEAAKLLGINEATASTQYGHWKRAHKA